MVRFDCENTRLRMSSRIILMLSSLVLACFCASASAVDAIAGVITIADKTPQEAKQPKEPPIDQTVDVAENEESSDAVNPETGADTMYEDAVPLPNWVKRGDYEDEAQGAQYFLVASKKRLKQREAEGELEELLIAKIQNQINEKFGGEASRVLELPLTEIRKWVPRNEQCDDDGIYHHILIWQVPETLQSKLNSENREAYQCFSQLKLDADFHRWAQSQWDKQIIKSRILQMAILGFSALFTLIVGFAYLTAEHKTRGFYSKRLQTVGLIVLFTGLAAMLYFASQFTWL